MAEQAPQTSPRGTDRTRRRAAQQAATAQAATEAANMTSPDTPEKRAKIEANKARVAKFGETPGGIRKAKQAANRAAAERETAALNETLPTIAPALKPGEQVSLQTANRFAKVNDLSERDFVESAAQAAGLAVRTRLNGQPLRDRHNRSRHIAQHNAKVEAAARAQK